MSKKRNKFRHKNTPFKDAFKQLAVDSMGFSKEDAEKVNPHKLARMIGKKISPPKK